jgi:DUF4097 and DUF4098 domain-containing protein YvlB
VPPVVAVTTPELAIVRLHGRRADTWERPTNPVSATSGNGRIDVRMASLRGDDTMDFRTGNGNVIVTVPADFEAEVDARSGHGTLRSAFPMLVEGRLDPQHVRGTIGKGGRRVRLSSGNGDLVIRRIE